MEVQGKGAGVSGGFPLAGVRGSAPSTLPRASFARGIQTQSAAVLCRLDRDEMGARIRSCAALLLKTGEQDSFGGLHFQRRLRVAFVPRQPLQLLDGHTRLKVTG